MELETERLTETRKKQMDYQRIPDGFQQALVKTLYPGEEVFWWEMPAFWDTYGPQRRVPRSFFAALIASSLFVWGGSLYWLFIFFFADEFEFLRIFEYIFVSFSICLFFAIIEGIYFIIGYGFGLAEGLGQGLYVITDQRLIRIYQRLFFSKASGFSINSTFYRDILEFAPLRGGENTCLEASLGQLRLEMYPDDSGVCLYDPIFLYPLASSSLFSTRKETQKALDPDNILLALNGFLYVSNIREIVDLLQFITNGQLSSATTSFTAKPPGQRQTGDFEMMDIENGRFVDEDIAEEEGKKEKIEETEDEEVKVEEGKKKEREDVETQKKKKKKSEAKKSEAQIRREENWKKEIVRRVVIGLAVIIGGSLVIGVFGWLMRYLRVQHGEDVAAVGLIPAVFGSWLILLSGFFCLFWYGFGPRVDVFHISLSNLNGLEDEDWIDQ
eukprot:TRINITY_DN11129_c0_g1_i1.p1 TRINITY_DN11129_c0_g1~~TRINITY_DN11129_c0_g1_i1.p1  ORF type:complete len:442 (-),score=77.00 TRINITY_DN11129_c0_g1_i1:111-1436(-)